MPNWCGNTMTVSGDPRNLKDFLDKNMGFPAKYPPIISPNGKVLSKSDDVKEKYFCFNAFIPTPQEVLDVGFDGQAKIPKEEYDKLLHGGETKYIDGYHWNWKNWGTKWDIYSERLSLEEIGWSEGCDSVEICFDTAWSPPIPWFEALVKAFPSLVFTMHYEEPGVFFAGNCRGENGVFTHNECTEEECYKLFDYLFEESDIETS